MGLLIAATYLILSGIIVYLLILHSKQKTDRCVGVRDTMLAAEELQKHAMDIARNHPVGRSAKSLHWLVRRLNDNYGFIINVYKALNIDIQESFPTAPAAEWLLDNFYIIEEQVKLIRKNLSRGQYSRLPVLKEGYLKGYPRVYAIALEMVGHSNGSIDEKTITSFIQAYQSQAMLSMGELWAVPLMIRIALVESIRNVCGNIHSSRIEWHRAEELVTRIASCESDEKLIDRLLSSYLDEGREITPSFTEHLIQRLRKHGKGLSTVTALLDLRLGNEHTSTEKLTGSEHQMQAEMQVAIGNSITGLRLISDIDWSDIFEMLSKVEQILRTDPNGVYGLMDFESRDYYRHEVEKLSRAFGVSEIHVADRATECARSGIGRTPADHVGYYLVGRGRRVLLDMLGKSAKRRWRPSFTAGRKPRRVYAAIIAFLTAFLVSYFMYYASTHDNSELVIWPLLTAFLLLIPCSEFAVNITNTIISHIYSPTMLPKLELRDGIPGELSAFVIVPTLLTSPARASELLHQMEVYYLANREQNLFFALVGDFRDAASEHQDNDDEIVGTVMNGIRELNRLYSGDGRDIFYYMHRRRTYNRMQNRWMGWERKRGAIIEFNRLLKGQSDAVFSADMSELPPIRYVITLDADTNLPMGAARKLIGTIAHPLNRAVVDEKTGIVSEGYGLLQPRICVGISSANRTLFTRIFAGQGGIDPYTTAVSDIYQDIFDEGIFTGKGIYEVDVFQRVLENRIPDNTVLSHDLIEGCHVRAGLVSDIELVDGYPSNYNSYAMRQHRWVRGDWQLLPWLAGQVRDREGNKYKNCLSGISKWKIIDNLRRSLLYPSIFVLFTAGMLLLPGDDLVWTGFAVLVTFSPLTMGFLNALLTGNLRFVRSRTNSSVITGVKAAIFQSVLLFAFIPHQTYLMMDAVLRTVCRVLLTHRNMLEWVTAADAEASARNSAESYFRKMWFTLPAAASVLIPAVLFSRESFILAAAAALVWLLSPLLAYRVGIPVSKKKSRLTDSELILLRKAARKTWRYFEDFAGEDDNYLPPDNYQEDPPKGAAHRTSPTNIGLLLVSVQTACDMGYISWNDMSVRLERIISTIERLEKWKGHLYNWYDTMTLETLRPLYVSTVDSGNLVGYMMLVREGLKEYLDKKLPHPSMASGLLDTLELACGEQKIDAGFALRTSLSDLAGAKEMDLVKWAEMLNELDRWVGSVNAGTAMPRDGWFAKLGGMAAQFSAELLLLYPFLSKPETLRSLDSETADFLCRPGSPAELINRYRNAAGQPGGVKNDELATVLSAAAASLNDILAKHRELISRLSKLIDDTKFSPLFDQKRLLFSIGYNVEDGHLSKSYYDLLASEARQASYIAIARGEVDRRHWIRMGRKLTAADGGKGLVSWTGTMFEYLMPLLIMRNYENTIFDETYSFVVRVQKKYCKQRRIPWGISESGYSVLDFGLNYQYKAFGVPELGLKRGLANDMVTAPYASILALGIDAAAVAENLRELSGYGADGMYGYYEAIDFTPSRLEKDVSYRIVKSFMAHHQGMSLAALNNFFNGNILQNRFHADPVMQSAELLLQEKIPDKVMYTKEFKDESTIHFRRTEQTDGIAVRTFGVPKAVPPDVHILSNGAYCVMVTGGGSGYSMEGHTAITRWKADPFAKNGYYIFIHNINSNTAWSATYDPMKVEPDKYKAVFSPDKAEFMRKDGNLESHLEITVSPEDNAEVRRISITNHSEHVRVIEITSYFEAVIAPRHEDAAHPAFSKLFVKTEFVREKMCLLAARRQRKEGQKQQWLMHTMALDTDLAIGEMQYETDRMKFIGRNRSISDPAALEPDQPLSNSAGSVLDPVMSLRRRVRIEPGQTVKAVYTVALCQGRKHALALAEKYNDYRTSERVFELAWTRSQVESRYLGLEAGETEFYLELMPFILFNNPMKRQYSSYIADNTGSQKDLWPFGISGDIPLILVEVNEAEDMEMVYWALKGHEYWRIKGLNTDLVILVNKKEGYSQPLNEQIRNAVTASHARELVNKYAGVFIINSSEMDQAQIALFYTAAGIVVKESLDAFKSAAKGARRHTAAIREANRCKAPVPPNPITVHQPENERKLLFFNGIGGFSSTGKEYVIQLGNGRHTPAPWVNIIANKGLGFLVTESGGGYTWAENSREFKLTPWSNDPVTDSRGEAFYINDPDTGCHWSLTPMPAGDNDPYTVRHGHGYSVFEHNSYGIKQSLTMFVACEQQVRINLVSLTNITGNRRKLSITHYIRPVLGVDDNQTSSHLITWRGKDGILYIENKYSSDFKGRIAFLKTNLKDISVTCDRAEFIGQGGDLSEPYGLIGDSLSGATGAGYDTCAAVMGSVTLEPEEEVKVIFLLGSAADAQKAEKIAMKFSDIGSAEDELENVKEFWRKSLESIQVHTPDDSFDVMMNGWFLYQTIACRIWARSGYYQAGGAFGFRDQLQDSMAPLNSWPELTRNQILLHASRQFIEGDVQHWWHSESGKGIRTRYSDDLLWLAYVTSEYIEKTNDISVLGEQVHFLEGPPLKDGEDERYDEPGISDASASIYEHCVLAIDRSLARGSHGLPLIGCGDWNDGMNTVGNKGRGESVWLGWFLIAILQKFIPICHMMEDHKRVEAYRNTVYQLAWSLEKEAWDGSWYRRAYFDDGTPLGSVHNTECMIDSISQSWSVISGAAKPQRMREAMAAVQKYLVDVNEGIIKLLTPPFENGDLQPGYIKGYVAGVRENGGQYTHAAAWSVMAFTKLGMGDKASELFHMLNPINHTRTNIEYLRYKVEPYVIAADVYAAYPHTGRGGWTWYTGAAGWLYKVGLEHIAGFRKKGDRLYINPCIPGSWKGCTIDYRYKKSSYHIEIKNPDSVNCGVSYIAADGKRCAGGYISLEESGYHRVEVVMGAPFVSVPEAEGPEDTGNVPGTDLNATGSSIGKS